MKEKRYYIYFHYKRSNGEVFYIGQGTHTIKGKEKYIRAYYQHSGDFWNNEVKKHGYDVVIVIENLTFEQANFLETFFIVGIGRRDLGRGPLVNLNNGGKKNKGSSPESIKKRRETMKKKYASGWVHPRKGMKHSEEARKKMSESHKGLVPGNKGIPRTEEQKKKQSETRKQQYRDGLIQTNKGKKHTKETNEKHSQTIRAKYENGFISPLRGKPSLLKGRARSQETKEKLSQIALEKYKNGYIHPKTGKKDSEETKEKKSEALKKKYAEGWVNPRKGTKRSKKEEDKRKENRENKKKTQSLLVLNSTL